MHHFNFSQMLSGAVLYGTLAYAARTIPINATQHPYLRWAIGVIQFLLSNVEKGQAAMNTGKDS